MPPQRRKILLVSRHPTWPVRDGGIQRSNLLARALSECGELDLVIVSPPKWCTPEQVQVLQREHRLIRYCERVVPPVRVSLPPLVHRKAPALIRTLEALKSIRAEYSADPALSEWFHDLVRRERYDLIVCRFLLPALTVAAGSATPPVIVDMDDVDSEKWRLKLQMEGVRNWRQRLSGAFQVRYLQSILNRHLPRFAHCWFCKESDRRFGFANASVLPNVPYVAADEAPISPFPTATDSQEILFVGVLIYPPNRQGVDHFLHRIWPGVRSAVPNARVRIVGKVRDDWRSRWSGLPGVEVAGYVDDLRSAYERAAITMAPIYWGSGTNIKVIESLAHGRTCVATSYVAAGYQPLLRHGESIWSANDDEQFATGCIRLLKDQALRTSLETRGRELVSRHLSYDAFRAIVLRTVQQVLGGTGAASTAAPGLATDGAPPVARECG